MFKFNTQHVANKSSTTYGCKSFLLLYFCFRRSILANDMTIMTKGKRNIKAAQCNALKKLINMSKLGFISAQEFSPCGSVKEEIQHFHCRANRMSSGLKFYRHISPFT